MTRAIDPTESHSVLAPSSAERWISCPASIRLSQQIEMIGDYEPSSYAQEGSAAHALAELTARHRLLGHTNSAEYGRAVFAWRTQWAEFVHDEDEMQAYVDGYVEFISKQDGTLLLEQRMPTGVPSCWGTADAVSVNVDSIHVTDLKYGQGVRVDAVDNPQLMLYGVAALHLYGDILGQVEYVHMSIYQPRIGNIATTSIRADDLRGWRDGIIPVAEEAMGPNARFGPSEAACRWCPASGQCAAQRDWAVARDFSLVASTLSPDEIRDALEAIPAIEEWCAAVRAHALDLIYSKGRTVPGFKVVKSAGKRYVHDPDGAIEALDLIGYEMNQIVNSKIKGIGELEKLLGKKVFASTMTPFVKKSDGTISLVPDSDERPSITPHTEAASIFAGIVETETEKEIES